MFNRTMRVIGVEANVGSMLYPFLQRGHDVIGLCDSRPIVSEENFLINFPNSKFYPNPESMYDLKDIDVMCCQPSCGRFSSLSKMKKGEYEDLIDLKEPIEAIRPKVFFIESKVDFIYQAPKPKGYKINFEWISNYHYGNTQKRRSRLWVMGVREDIDWEFTHGEKRHNNTVEEVISGLSDRDIPDIDHIHEWVPYYKDSRTKEYYTLDEAFEVLKKTGRLPYIATDGKEKYRIGRKLADPKISYTITGGAIFFHWRKKWPLTLREKARIQGFPDGFSFKGMPKTRQHMAVGKSMPQNFIRYLVSTLEGDKPAVETKILPEPKKLTEFKKNIIEGEENVF